MGLQQVSLALSLAHLEVYLESKVTLIWLFTTILHRLDSLDNLV